jgi:hypothetical protein
MRNQFGVKNEFLPIICQQSQPHSKKKCLAVHFLASTRLKIEEEEKRCEYQSASINCLINNGLKIPQFY